MSKIVKRTFGAFKKIVKGTLNAVKKFAKSKIGKIIIAAAAIYFGGAALSGALSSTAGSSALTGITNAWTSLGTAGGELLAGNLGNVGSALSTGIQGGSAVMEAGQLVASGLGGVAPSASTLAQAPAAMTTPGAAVTSPVTNSLSPLQAVNATTGAPVAAQSEGGLISSAWNSLGPYGKMAAVQMGGSVVQGIGAQKAADEQRAYEEQQANAARDRYNTNVGSMWWNAPAQGAAPLPMQQQGLIGANLNYQVPSYKRYM